MIRVLLASVLLCGGFIPTILAQTVKLQRQWETGREHHLRYESVQRMQPLRLGKPLGAGPTVRLLNEFSLTAWPKPEGGQFYGQRWLVNAIETKVGREVRGFDSRATAKSKNYDAPFAQAWEIRRGAVFYTDGTAEGQAGAGYLAEGLAADFPTPVSFQNEFGAPVRQRLVKLPGAPAEPVGAGHSWTVPVEGRLRGALVETTATFRFDRIERLEGRSCAVVKVDAVFAEVPDAALKATLEAARKLSAEVPDPATLSAPRYAKAMLEGEVWLDTATGVGVREKTVAKMLSTPNEDKIQTELVDTDEMTLVAIKPVDPAQPPPVWHSREEVAQASPTAAPSPSPPAAAPRPGASSLATRWQPGLRYVHRVRNTQEGKQFIPAMKQTIPLANLREGETETLVTSAETAGEMKLTTRNLHLTTQTSVNGQKMSFDSRKVGAKPGPLEAMGLMEAKMVFVSRVDAAGEIKDVQVEGLPSTKPPGFTGSRPEPWKEPLPWIGPLPTGHRALGERWTAKFLSRHQGCGEVESDQQWTFARMETVEGRECVVLEVAATLTDLQGQPAQPRVDDALLEKGQVEAALWIEPATATVVRWKTKADLRVQYAAPGAPNSGWRTETVATHESTLLSMTPVEASPTSTQATPAGSPAVTKTAPASKPSPDDVSLPAWAQSEDPRIFTLGFYKWYYGKLRDLRRESPVLSKRADILPVIAALVSPKIVRDAADFIKTDGEKGGLPFVPGNDFDALWGDNASVTAVEKVGERTRVRVFLKGTSKGYEKFHQSDAVLLEKRATGWVVAANEPAAEAPVSVAPTATSAGGVTHLSPSKAYGVVIKKSEDGDIETADLVTLPGKKAIHPFVEKGDYPIKVDWRWNPSSTQVASYFNMKRGGYVSVGVIQGGKLIRREIPEFELPIVKAFGQKIERFALQGNEIKAWSDDQTLILRPTGRVKIVEKKGAEPYYLDYEYEVPISCPLKGKLTVGAITKINVSRFEE